MTAAARRVLIVNPASGGGRAQEVDLVGHCGQRGIMTVVRGPGDDISELARSVVAEGVDVLGVAGGDGSQSAVAAVAAEAGVAFVCVPAGTRNHFALDLGLDRRDVLGAVEAFVEGTERRVDLARVNGRLFVNNASMGLYGRVVQSQEYRDAKLRSFVDRLPDIIGPEAERFDLRFTDPDGRAHPDAAVLLVSNNPYVLDPRPGHGTRGSLDGGTLGVISITGGPPWQGLREWATPAFRVDSGREVAVGLDGEAVVLEPPLVFESVPSALRVIIPRRRQR